MERWFLPIVEWARLIATVTPRITYCSAFKNQKIVKGHGGGGWGGARKIVQRIMLKTIQIKKVTI